MNTVDVLDLDEPCGTVDIDQREHAGVRTVLMDLAHRWRKFIQLIRWVSIGHHSPAGGKVHGKLMAGRRAGPSPTFATWPPGARHRSQPPEPVPTWGTCTNPGRFSLAYAAAMSMQPRCARVENVGRTGLAMPDVTVKHGSHGNSIYQVRGKSFVFFYIYRPMHSIPRPENAMQM